MTCWTEWDPLEEVIVGDCFLLEDLNWKLPNKAASNFAVILEETKEDLNKLAECLKDLGVKVHRPIPKKNEQDIKISTFDIKYATAPIVPRDQYLVYGNTIYQTYTSLPDRYIDSLSYYEIFRDLFKQGYNWISQPAPELTNFSEDEDGYFVTNGEHIYREKYKDTILWHTASMAKYGDTLLTNWGPGTELGLEWMRKNTPNSKIVVNHNKFGHIDHGFYNINDDTIICSSVGWVPDVLKNKRLISVDKISQHGYNQVKDKIQDFRSDFVPTAKLSDKWLDRWMSEWKGYFQDVSYDGNTLVVDPQNIIYNSYEPKIFKLLDELGVNCHYVPFRHGYFWEAGTHCLTLDIKRKGNSRKIIDL